MELCSISTGQDIKRALYSLYLKIEMLKPDFGNDMIVLQALLT